jgi:hypothetical protein
VFAARLAAFLLTGTALAFHLAAGAATAAVDEEAAAGAGSAAATAAEAAALGLATGTPAAAALAALLLARAARLSEVVRSFLFFLGPSAGSSFTATAACGGGGASATADCGAGGASATADCGGGGAFGLRAGMARRCRTRGKTRRQRRCCSRRKG